VDRYHDYVINGFKYIYIKSVNIRCELGTYIQNKDVSIYVNHGLSGDEFRIPREELSSKTLKIHLYDKTYEEAIREELDRICKRSNIDVRNSMLGYSKISVLKDSKYEMMTITEYDEIEILGNCNRVDYRLKIDFNMLCDLLKNP
jgi:hypothetical protein